MVLKRTSERPLRGGEWLVGVSEELEGRGRTGWKGNRAVEATNALSESLLSEPGES